MTETQMTAILAQAMNGQTGEALRMFLSTTFGTALNEFIENPQLSTDAYRGLLLGFRIITTKLEGMGNAYEMMREKED